MRRPRHPYTEGLVGSTVDGVAKGARLTPILGSPPNLAALPAGCSFAPRCPYVIDRCGQALPDLRSVENGGRYLHATRCIQPERIGERKTVVA